jgi:DNA invertase Pin-like site-specific DNA recombinase
MNNIGYIRVSTDLQNRESQKLAILEYANRHNTKIDDWIEITISSRKSRKARRIDELIDRLQKNDTLIVSELSRLGRSVGEVAGIVDQLIQKNINLICIKENINLSGKHNIQSKTMITMFSLFAEIERDLISERTKEGIANARKKGVTLGRPIGTTGISKLDGKENEIKDFLKKGVNVANLAKIYDCTWITMKSFIKSRKLFV